MSPARMYSRARATAARYASRENVDATPAMPGTGHVGGRSRTGAGAAGGGVPGQDPVVEADAEVGEREVVVRRLRQRFQVLPELVAEVAGGAALERRQPWQRVRAVARQRALERGERIGIHAPDAR